MVGNHSDAVGMYAQGRPAIKTLVTGANGFVGRRLCSVLVDNGYDVRRACRRPLSSATGNQAPAETQIVGEIGPETDWSIALHGVDTIIHLAARVHVMHERNPDPVAAYRRVNTEGTLALARQAAQQGVKRLVYISTIKVNGETTIDTPFRETDKPNPADAYAQSKYEAEQALQELAIRTGLEVVIVRPPLVYGPGVVGNFHTLLEWVERGVPLPLASIRNRRSFIGLDNLVSLLIRCAAHPAAANEKFLASDGESLSTPEWLRRVARALDRPARLLSVPVPVLTMAAGMMGRRAVCDRLCGSLEVDSGKSRERLGWSPVATIDQELHRTAEAFRRSVQR